MCISIIMKRLKFEFIYNQKTDEKNTPEINIEINISISQLFSDNNKLMHINNFTSPAPRTLK